MGLQMICLGEYYLIFHLNCQARGLVDSSSPTIFSSPLWGVRSFSAFDHVMNHPEVNIRYCNFPVILRILGFFSSSCSWKIHHLWLLSSPNITREPSTQFQHIRAQKTNVRVASVSFHDFVAN